MKIAQFRYTYTNLDISVSLYFDSKAFDFFPQLSSEDEKLYIRQVCDSIAATMPKEGTEKQYFIKRLVRYPATNQFKLLCTDGFLVDESLLIPLVRQPFAEERIKITDVEPPPARVNDMLKTMNDRLPIFEDNVKHDMAQGKLAVLKEAVKVEKTTLVEREYISERISDIFAEIGNIKKEITQIAETNIKTLQSLLVFVEGSRQRTYDTIMQETKSNLKSESANAKLQEFATKTISQYGGGEVEKSRELLLEKVQQIGPIPAKFATEVEENTQHISERVEKLEQFKRLLIVALYKSAQQYRDVLLTQMQNATLNAKKMMINDFNKKFGQITTMAQDGGLTDIEMTYQKLQRLSLESLQELISNDDKENLGLLQKCNTSWVEESPELQIVLKNLNSLNNAYKELFKDDPQYAKADMIQIIRIPFPRGFQFKFTDSALGYKKSIEDYCKEQKDNFINMAKAYKKAMQTDDVREKTQRAIADIERQTEQMKHPVVAVRDLLQRAEASYKLSATAQSEYEQTQRLMSDAKKLQDLAKVKIDLNYSLLIGKISTHIEHMRSKAGEVANLLKKTRDTKAQMDATIDNYDANARVGGSEIEDLNKKMHQNVLLMHEKNKEIREEHQHLSTYEQIMRVVDIVTAEHNLGSMRKYQTEAKTLIAQLIKNQSRHPAFTEEVKKHMLDLYAKMDTNIHNIEKADHELDDMKGQLFTELNIKEEISLEQVLGEIKVINDKITSITAARKVVDDNFADLKKLGMELI